MLLPKFKIATMPSTRREILLLAVRHDPHLEPHYASQGLAQDNNFLLHVESCRHTGSALGHIHF